MSDKNKPDDDYEIIDLKDAPPELRKLVDGLGKALAAQGVPVDAIEVGTLKQPPVSPRKLGLNSSTEAEGLRQSAEDWVLTSLKQGARPADLDYAALSIATLLVFMGENGKRGAARDALDNILDEAIDMIDTEFRNEPELFKRLEKAEKGSEFVAILGDFIAASRKAGA